MKTPGSLSIKHQFPAPDPAPDSPILYLLDILLYTFVTVVRLYFDEIVARLKFGYIC